MPTIRLKAVVAATVWMMWSASLVSAAVPEEPKLDAEPVSIRLGQIDIKGAYPEGAPQPGLFGEISEGLSDGLARLERAAEDDKLEGLLLKIDGPQLGWAKLYEFRKAVGGVQKAGKKVYAWLDGGSSMDYLLATQCDQVAMPESGVLMVLGLRAEVSFYKNLFDKLDIKPEMLRVGEFKAAAEPYTRTDMSPAFREEMEAILDDYYRQMVNMIAESRKLAPEDVQAAIDEGPLSAKDALKRGLIDHIAYEDEFEDTIKTSRGADKLNVTRKYGKKKVDTDFSGFAGMVKMMNLLMGIEEPRRRSSLNKIAVIYATGAITTGASTTDVFGGASLGSDTMIKAIRKANEDDRVKALVLRVDSPGGSALASDLMWRELERVEKPFVVSMGNTAASGGYYISMGADRIFAEPGTLTGSIGVVGGKLAMEGLYEKAGITTSVISRGRNSGVMSTTTGFTDSEREAMVKLLYDVYDQFTAKAAAGRKMKQEDLEKLARGRVYTGAMALKIGLVDELGSLDDAISHARKLAGLDPNDNVEKLILPKPVSPFEALFGPIDLDARVGQIRGRQAQLLRESLEAISPEMAGQLGALHTLNILAREPRLTILPFKLTVK